MKLAASSSILRGMAVGGQPRTLRPSRTKPVLAAVASAPAVDERAADDDTRALLAAQQADAERRGYAEGYARGHAQGVESGTARGIENARAGVDDAVRRATESSAAEAAARRREADAAMAALRERVRVIEHEFERAAAARLDALEHDAMALAFEAVCRIVGEGEDRAVRVRDLIGAATRRLAGATLLRVRVHPDDLAALNDANAGEDRSAAAASRSAVVEWIADRTIDSPGCIVESNRGSIDARLDLQLARLRDVWRGVGQ